jgi:hypothetical protein
MSVLSALYGSSHKLVRKILHNTQVHISKAPWVASVRAQDVTTAIVSAGMLSINNLVALKRGQNVLEVQNHLQRPLSPHQFLDLPHPPSYLVTWHRGTVKFGIDYFG